MPNPYVFIRQAYGGTHQFQQRAMEVASENSSGIYLDNASGLATHPKADVSADRARYGPPSIAKKVGAIIYEGPEFRHLTHFIALAE